MYNMDKRQIPKKVYRCRMCPLEASEHIHCAVWTGVCTVPCAVREGLQTKTSASHCIMIDKSTQLFISWY